MPYAGISAVFYKEDTGMNITGERLRLYAVTDRAWAADEEALFRQIGEIGRAHV